MGMQHETLSAVLDELVPPRLDPAIAGAGRPEVVAYVAAKLSETGVGVLVDPGLSALNERSRGEFGTDFASLAQPQRAPLMRAIEPEHPFLLPILLLHTYPGYYQQPDVLEALGCDARPPFPKGHEVDVGDDALLAKIRARIGRP